MFGLTSSVQLLLLVVVACLLTAHAFTDTGDVLELLAESNFVAGAYVEPSYFQRLEASYMDPFFAEAEDTRLRRCVRRPLPPAEGAECAKRPKTCFFGTQSRTCADGSAGDHPVTKCECVGGTSTNFGTWTCSDVEEVCAETVTPEILGSIFRGMSCEEVVRPGILDIYPTMEVVCCETECTTVTNNDHIIAFVVDGVVDSFEVLLSPFE